MDSDNGTARAVGALFLFSNVTFLAGAFFLIEPQLTGQAILEQFAAHRAEAVFGVLLEMANAFAYLGIAALMFPIFRRRFEALGLSYFGLRTIEFVTQILAVMPILGLVTLSEISTSAAAGATTTMLVSQRAWAFQMLGLAFGVSAMMFYSMFYRMPIIPRFISVWGFLGGAFVLLTTVFDMLSVNLGVFQNLGLLMLLNELFLGVWLIVKGFQQEDAHASPGSAA